MTIYCVDLAVNLQTYMYVYFRGISYGHFLEHGASPGAKIRAPTDEKRRNYADDYKHFCV